jgi:hypothetical protein
MIRGNIAIPDTADPKRWRARGRKRKLAVTVPTIVEAKSPAEIKRDQRIRRLRELTELIVRNSSSASFPRRRCSAVAMEETGRPHPLEFLAARPG